MIKTQLFIIIVPSFRGGYGAAFREKLFVLNCKRRHSIERNCFQIILSWLDKIVVTFSFFSGTVRDPANVIAMLMVTRTLLCSRFPHFTVHQVKSEVTLLKKRVIAHPTTSNCIVTLDSYPYRSYYKNGL